MEIQMAMIGKDLTVKAIREKTGVTVAQAEAAYDTVMAYAKEVLDAGDTFRIPDVGVIRRNDIDAHEATNPATGDAVQVPKRYNYKIKSTTRDVE